MSRKVPAYLIALSTFLACCNRPKNAFKIYFERSGCFSGEQSELLLYKEGSSYVAQLKTKGQKTRTVTIGEGYIPIIPLFVRELKALKNNRSCTTIDTYTVFIDGEVIKTTDGSCNWFGFDRIKNAFFPDKE